MCPRSQTSGLRIGLVTRSRSRSSNGATSARVRSRASARSGSTASTRRSLSREARAAPDLHDLADRSRPVGDARVQGADGELEAARFLLVELRDQGMEAPPALVHEHDVAGADALRRGAPGRLGVRGRRNVDQPGLRHATGRYAPARTDSRTAAHTPRWTATLASRSVRTATIAEPSAASARSSAASKPARSVAFSKPRP